MAVRPKLYARRQQLGAAEVNSIHSGRAGNSTAMDGDFAKVVRPFGLVRVARFPATSPLGTFGLEVHEAGPRCSGRFGWISPRLEMESRMEALLTAIVVWLSCNFPLPASVDHPRIKFVSAAEMIAPLRQNQQQRSGIATTEINSEIVSLYSNESKTIYLMDGWTGNTPAELSILVHEMVHHLQNVGQLKFACAQEREELAYKAQESWLRLFGRDLERDFQMDSFTVLVKSKCF